MNPLKSEDLLRRYAEICDQALRENKDRFPFKQILSAAREHGTGQSVRVRISGAQEKAIYVLCVGEKGIEIARQDQSADEPCVREWVVENAFLQHVVDQADSFVKNPAKINWDWMFDA